MPPTDKPVIGKYILRKVKIMVRKYKSYLVIMTFLFVLLVTGCKNDNSGVTTFSGIATTVRDSSVTSVKIETSAKESEASKQEETSAVHIETTTDKTETTVGVAATTMATSVVTRTQNMTTVMPTTVAERKHRQLKVMLPEASGKQVSSLNGYIIDYSNTKNGYVMVKNTTGITTYVQITCNSVMRQYKMQSGNYETYPLTMGNGKYKIQVLQIASNGLGYDKNTIEIDVGMENGNIPYLYANTYVNFYNGSMSAEKSYELAYEGDDDAAVTNRIAEFVAENISYDYGKAASVTSGTIKSYVPSPDATLSSGKGICTDYASLVAAMLRAQGIPCKMVYGYINNGAAYHAWNQVYYGGSWHLVDACIRATGGSASAYVTDKEY